MERVKYFRKDDPPNMRNLNLEEIKEAQKQAILNPHRMSTQQLRELEIDSGNALKHSRIDHDTLDTQLKSMVPKVKYRLPFEIATDSSFMLMDPDDSKELEVQNLRIKSNFRSLVPTAGHQNPIELESKKFSVMNKDILKINACNVSIFSPKVIESDLKEAIKKQKQDLAKKILSTVGEKSQQEIFELLQEHNVPMEHFQSFMQTIQMQQSREGGTVQTPQPAAPFMGQPFPGQQMFPPSVAQAVLADDNEARKNMMLGVKRRPPNYKTVPCRNFHGGIGCIRGDACHFIHDYKYIGQPVPPEELMKYRGLAMMNYQQQMPMGPMPPMGGMSQMMGQMGYQPSLSKENEER